MPRISTPGVARRRFLCACCAGAAIGWVPTLARSADQRIPTRLEPHHHVRLENDYLRVLQIAIDPGDATLWHEHSLDFAGVTVRASELRNETPNSDKAAVIQAKPGAIAWFNYQGHSYVHRIVDIGREPFVVDGFEILTPAPKGYPVSDRKQSPAYALELDNDRLRAWRLKLAPGESAAPIAQGGPGFRVLLAGERITETTDGAEHTIQLTPGDSAYQRRAAPVPSATADRRRSNWSNSKSNSRPGFAGHG